MTEEPAKAAADGFSVGDLLTNEKLYGERSPVRAVIKPGGQPRFDYAAELAEAREAFPKLATLLNLDAAARPRPKPAVEGEPAATKVTGMGGGEQMTLRIRLSPEQLRSLKAIGEGDRPVLSHAAAVMLRDKTKKATACPVG